MRNVVVAVGDQSIRLLELLGGISKLTYDTACCAFTPPYNPRGLLQQVDHIGVKSISIASVAAVFTGLVLALQTAYGLSRFGAKAYVGIIVSLSIVRELGPVLTALLVGGRVGSGITAELGSMKVTEQIDAMRAMGANPIKKLVVPRVLSAMLVLPLLTVMADILGILGGMVISRYEFQVDYQLYYNTVTRNLTVADIVSGLGKTVVFGFIIAIVGCYSGLETRGGTEGIGKATTTTVVTSAIAIIISDFFLTKFFWWLEGW
ncbi:MlaE family ABC transporter permease [Candidatus Methylomirabilis limnetica]|uniref:MlaE family ABC transporter permease n=1 Tax=Candidatus Methylomirabilis limnetica TaxID=2033718 RepID=UPI001EFDE0C1|nr:ABC transporter permease [Candidatus Methylomirabilis limnetica]